MVKTAGHGAERGVFGVERFQQNGHQRRLPVVAVEDVGGAEDLGGLQHRAREQGEALGVVGIVARGRAVELLAVEERRIVDEVEFDAGVGAAVEHRAEAVLVVKGHGDAAQQGARTVEPGLAVLGKVNVHLVADGSQSRRQSAHHVGETAGLRERNTLRGHKGNAHQTTSGIPPVQG